MKYDRDLSDTIRICFTVTYPAPLVFSWARYCSHAWALKTLLAAGLSAPLGFGSGEGATLPSAAFHSSRIFSARFQLRV
jgi:hypothetical protein